MMRPTSVSTTPTPARVPIPIPSASASQLDNVTYVTANPRLQQEASDESTTIQQNTKGNDNSTVGEVVASGEHSIGLGNVGRDVYIDVRPKWAGKPFQAPPLPPNFVDRPQPRLELKKLLLDRKETTPGTLVVSAIYGLGGIGKSTLATALAHDADIHEQFADGILWATLGQQPDILSFLSTWIHALGDSDYKPTTKEAASTHLRTLLYDKRILLVVDDAWNLEDIEPFQVGGSDCRVLVTTREAPVRGASRYDLDMMSPEEALELLNKCRPGILLSQMEQEQAKNLAKALGYLPLALELAAAQVADGVAWLELLEDLQAEVARLETLDRAGAESARCEASRKHLSLKASFNLSLRLLSPEQLQQFAWLGVLPEDVSVGQQTAAVLWQVIPRQAGAILRTLRSKALLLFGAVQSGDKPTYRLHDLMHDRAKQLLTNSANPTQPEELPGLGLTLKEAHAGFLERYRALAQNGQWYNLSDDGYIHAYLAWHLEQADQSQQLHQLLQAETSTGRNAWYEACDQLGKTANFVTDVARAWRLAEAMFEENPEDAIALQCRYALIIASLNSLANNIPPELMAALVQKQVWTPAQGVAYAQQVQELSRRAEAFEKLAPHLPPILLPQALEAARAIQDESDRAKALSTLAPLMPEILPEALEAARAIQDEGNRAFTLSTLAPQMPEILPEALEAARRIQEESDRADALSILVPQMPEILPEALKAARAIQNVSYRAEVLSTLAPQMPEILPEALEAARAIQNESFRALALSTLAPQMPEILPEALEVARTIQNESFRALALSFLAPQMPEILLEALEVARVILHDYNPPPLRSLVPHLPETLLKEALEATRAIQDEYYRAAVLWKLVPQIPEILPEVLEAARAIHEKYARAHALRNLASQIPEILPEALEAARAIQDERDRANALRNLAPHLPEILPEALEAARAIQDEHHHADALRNLTPQVPEILPEALEATRAIQDESDRASALKNLVPQIPEILPEALEAARAIQDESKRADALKHLAPHLPEILPEALEAARTIKSESDRADALKHLAPHLPETLLKEALEASRTIQSGSYRASTLSGIIPQLKSSSFDYFFWKESLHLLVDGGRKNLLRDISELSSVIVALGGKEALAQTAQAIQEVGRQWS